MSHPLLKWFEFSHLPEHLKSTSRNFYLLANQLDESLGHSAEKTVALRKLLESKDAAVRARIDDTSNSSQDKEAK